MSHLSQTDQIFQFLEQNPDQHFTARDIAQGIIEAYPSTYKAKRSNPRFHSDKDLVNQVVAEIGSRKSHLLQKSSHIRFRDKPRPRVYWYQDKDEDRSAESLSPEHDSTTILNPKKSNLGHEHDLYPLLIKYLDAEHNLLCKRIDEKTSKNNKGAGGNHWLHPDIVAMEPIAEPWHAHIKECLRSGGGQSVRLWSFEVKKCITMSNVRESFYQAVSNSSWAHCGYLVATEVREQEVEKELRILSSLHGIGVMLLNQNEPSESEILFPAQFKSEADWQSMNRIMEQNADFENFVDRVSNYYTRHKYNLRDWDNPKAK